VFINRQDIMHRVTARIRRYHIGATKPGRKCADRSGGIRADIMIPIGIRSGQKKTSATKGTIIAAKAFSPIE
jgi:hypothetical protein